jgi:TRAP-type transport system small permease protein
VQKTLDIIDRVFMGMVVVAMAIIVTTIACDVVGRYGFGKSILFANELSRLSFIWLSFLVMPLGISKGLHVAITTVLDKVPPFVTKLLFRAGALSVIVLMVVVFMGAWVSIKGRSGEMLNTLPVSAAWFYYPLALGSAWSIVHLAVQFVRGEAPKRDVTDEVVQVTT